jgi:hypothetical protein
MTQRQKCWLAALLGFLLVQVLNIYIWVFVVKAEPYVVCDDSTSLVTFCEFESFPIPCTMEGAHISVDVGNPLLVPGTYTLKACFCVLEGTVKWCSGWSDPFTFTKPSVIRPAGIKVRLLK